MNYNRENLFDRPSRIENVHSSSLSRYQRGTYKLQLRFLFFLSSDVADLQTNGPSLNWFFSEEATRKNKTALKLTLGERVLPPPRAIRGLAGQIVGN